MKRLLCLLALLAILTPLNAAADTFTLYNYFPDIQGDNGLYAGAWNPSTNTYKELVDVGSFAFAKDASGANPRVEKFSSETLLGVLMQPSASEYAILSGHPPKEPELINVSGQFQYIGADEVKVSIGTITGSTLSIRQKWTLTATEGNDTISFYIPNILVSPDISLYFAVNADGEATNDSTLLSGSITTVPAPGALLLLGSGLLGLAAWGRVSQS